MQNFTSSRLLIIYDEQLTESDFDHSGAVAA